MLHIQDKKMTYLLIVSLIVVGTMFAVCLLRGGK